MGLLTEGEPLSWEETAKLADHVRQHGVKQVKLSHLEYSQITIFN